MGRMIGDREWHEGLTHRYLQHCADSVRLSREPLPFDHWAVDRTWVDFVRLARLVLALPAFVWSDWETHNPVPGVHGSGFRSVVLARRLISALVMVQQVLTDMRSKERKAYRATRRYLDDGRCEAGQERSLAKGRRFVHDWLIARVDKPGLELAALAKEAP